MNFTFVSMHYIYIKFLKFAYCLYYVLIFEKMLNSLQNASDDLKKHPNNKTPTRKEMRSSVVMAGGPNKTISGRLVKKQQRFTLPETNASP